MSLIVLPADAEAKAETFPHLSMITKQQLINVVKGKPPEDQTKFLLGQLNQNGMAADFYRYLLTHESSARVPNNKRMNPVQTK